MQAAIAVVAAGGATAVVDLLLDEVNNGALVVVLTLVFKILVAFAQNYLEAAGRIPAILPTPGLVTKDPSTTVVGEVVGTVDTTVGTVTGVVTDVVNTAGDVVGGVVGTVDSGIDLVDGLLLGKDSEIRTDLSGEEQTPE